MSSFVWGGAGASRRASARSAAATGFHPGSAPPRVFRPECARRRPGRRRPIPRSFRRRRWGCPVRRRWSRPRPGRGPSPVRPRLRAVRQPLVQALPACRGGSLGNGSDRDGRRDGSYGSGSLRGATPAPPAAGRPAVRAVVVRGQSGRCGHDTRILRDLGRCRLVVHRFRLGRRPGQPGAMSGARVPADVGIRTDGPDAGGLLDGAGPEIIRRLPVPRPAFDAPGNRLARTPARPWLPGGRVAAGQSGGAGLAAPRGPSPSAVPRPAAGRPRPAAGPSRHRRRRRTRILRGSASSAGRPAARRRCRCGRRRRLGVVRRLAPGAVARVTAGAGWAAGAWRIGIGAAARLRRAGSAVCWPASRLRSRAQAPSDVRRCGRLRPQAASCGRYRGVPASGCFWVWLRARCAVAPPATARIWQSMPIVLWIACRRFSAWSARPKAPASPEVVNASVRTWSSKWPTWALGSTSAQVLRLILVSVCRISGQARRKTSTSAPGAGGRPGSAQGWAAAGRPGRCRADCAGTRRSGRCRRGWGCRWGRRATRAGTEARRRDLRPGRAGWARRGFVHRPVAGADPRRRQRFPDGLSAGRRGDVAGGCSPGGAEGRWSWQPARRRGCGGHVRCSDCGAAACAGVQAKRQRCGGAGEGGSDVVPGVIQTPLDAVDPGGNAALGLLGAGQQDAGAQQFQVQARRGGPGHLGERGIGDVSGAGELGRPEVVRLVL